MAEPQDMVVPLLREIQTQIADGRKEAMDRQRILIARLDRLESQQRYFSQALSADSLLGKLVTGESGQRIEALEKQVSELAAHK
jgi:hypothetical protein